MRAKMHPRAPQEHSRNALEWPRCAQDVPKRHPGAPKRGPRHAQGRLQPLQNRPRRAPGSTFGAVFAGSSVRKDLESIFQPFVPGARYCRHRFRIGFSHTERLSGICCIARPRARKTFEKSSKNAVLEGPKRSPDRPEPSEIAPGAIQDAEKPAKNAQKSTKDQPKAPKTRPRAKNVPT